MSKLIIHDYDDFARYTGQELGVSDYLKVTQEQINLFADATLDHQWIHVDPERARTESPYKKTIAHGYLTLSLLPYLWGEIVEVQNVKMLVNYGIESCASTRPSRSTARSACGPRCSRSPTCAVSPRPRSRSRSKSATVRRPPWMPWWSSSTTSNRHTPIRPPQPLRRSGVNRRDGGDGRRHTRIRTQTAPHEKLRTPTPRAGIRSFLHLKTRIFTGRTPCRRIRAILSGSSGISRRSQVPGNHG